MSSCFPIPHGNAHGQCHLYNYTLRMITLQLQHRHHRRFRQHHFLQFSPQQIRDHLPSSDPRSPPQSRKIQSTGKTIRKSEEQHWRDPSTSVLKSKASFVHLVLLNSTTTKMMNTSLRIDFWLKVSWRVSELSTSDDVEVIICCVATRVAFCSDGGSCEAVSDGQLLEGV